MPGSLRFRDDRPLQAMGAAFLAVWIWSGVAPHRFEAWVLENIPTAIFVALLVGSYRRFRFSNRSYLLMLIFLCLHTYGSHHTYAHAPPGNWLRETFGFERNHYDRVVHFLFGLLHTRPSVEILRHNTRMTVRWAWRATPVFILAVSSVYELLESWAARVFAPEAGETFLAMQGDPWDAQKDMTVAFVGSLLYLVLARLTGSWRRDVGDDRRPPRA